MVKFEHRIRFPWCIVFPVFVALHLNGIDLNYPSIGASDVFETCSSGSQAAKFSISVQSTGRKRKRNNVIDDSDSKLYEGVVCSKGSIVKESGQVLRLRKMSRERVFYLDRLDRNALNWACFPRIRVWKDADIRDACDADRGYADGDFGSLGVLDVAYGEQHPRDARDTEVKSDDEYVPL